MTKTSRLQVFQDLMMQYTSGWKLVERHPVVPSGSLGVAGEVPVFTRKVPPRHEEMDGYFKTTAYLHNHKPLWALAWLDIMATLDGRCYEM